MFSYPSYTIAVYITLIPKIKVFIIVSECKINNTLIALCPTGKHNLHHLSKIDTFRTKQHVYSEYLCYQYIDPASVDICKRVILAYGKLFVI